MVEVKILNESKYSNPSYAKKGDAGVDLYADIENDIILEPLARKLIQTNISIKLPDGYEAQIRPRSGLALHHGIGMINSPGTIDSDYRGEIGIILVNWGRRPFVVTRGQRIAQMVISKVYKACIKEVSTLDETKRGKGGFGHTGLG